MIMIIKLGLKLGGDNDGDDDKVNKEVEIWRPEPRSQKAPINPWKLRVLCKIRLQHHRHGQYSGGN